MLVETLPRHVAIALDSFLTRARARFGARLREARLYGSFARGSARPDSDVDVFVRIEDVTHGERGWLFELAADTSLEHLVTLHVFAPSPEEYEWLDQRECRLLRDVREEGVAL